MLGGETPVPSAGLWGLDDNGRLPPTEQERVLDWRLHEFLRIGFDYPYALSLAWSDADLHFVQDLVKRGCPHQLAARIA